MTEAASMADAGVHAGSRPSLLHGSESGSLAQGLSALTQPLKLRLQRNTGEATLRDYSTNVVLIEPLATMTAVEDFLFPRVMPRDPPAQSKPTAPAATAAAAAAAPALKTEPEREAAPAAAEPAELAQRRSGAGSTEADPAEEGQAGARL